MNPLSKSQIVATSDWKWFGNAGHFVCSRDCQFHLCTQVGKYLVSTVGEFFPSRRVREIHAEIHNPKWFEKNKNLKGEHFDSQYMLEFGFYEIGAGRRYETMVFKAGKPCDSKDCDCGLPTINGHELDALFYDERGKAAKGHLELCKKWSIKN